MSKVFLGALGVALLCGMASARVPRHSRPTTQITVTLSDRVKPYQPAPAGSERPTVTAEDVLSIEGLVGQIRSEHEQILIDLIQDTSDSQVDEKSDLYFRLGELYAKQQRFWRMKSVEAQRASEAATDVGHKSKLRSDSATAASKAKDYLLKTVKAYKALTDNERFRNYPKMDVALFYYGYTLQSGSYMKEARAVYDKLLKNFPNSKYVPEAHLAFADYFDNANQLADAETRYKHVLKFPKSSAYWYAKYKLGWIHLRLQRFQESLETFYDVAQATKNDKKQERLNLAAKQDFVRAYAEIGKPEKAILTFQRVDSVAAWELFHHLGTVYLERGKFERAVAAFRQMVSLSPKDPRACAWQYAVARSLLSYAGPTASERVAEAENLVKLHVSLATKISGRDADECRANASAMSSELGRSFHAEATKTSNTDTFSLAARLYQAFLDGFATDAARPEIQFLLAESLWASAAIERDDKVQIERWERAADMFATVAKTDPSRARDAAHAAVLARLNLLDGEPAPRPADAEVARRTQPPAPTALPAREAKLVDAIATYANLVADPKHRELGAARFVEANLYRRFHHHDKAATVYAGLVATHRDAIFAESAAMLALDSLITVQRLDEMLRLADQLAADSAFLTGKPELAKLVSYVRSRSMRR